MRIVRNLCLYRRRTQPSAFVPELTAFPQPHQSVRPYIFPEPEVARLLSLCAELPTGRYAPHRRELYRLVVTLLFATGIRRGELLQLTIGDYDMAAGTLSIRPSKFHKSRLLPLSHDVARELDAYVDACRQYHLPTPPERPLIWNCFQGSHIYSPPGLRFGLEALLSRAGIRTNSGRLPRTHDFRHSFAVNVLLRWYRAGLDVQAKLPLLAAFMGHVSIVSTYYYLHFIGPLAELASARFDHSYGRVVTANPAPSEKGSRL
jgi:integrase